MTKYPKIHGSGFSFVVHSWASNLVVVHFSVFVRFKDPEPSAKSVYISSKMSLPVDFFRASLLPSWIAYRRARIRPPACWFFHRGILLDLLPWL